MTCRCAAVVAAGGVGAVAIAAAGGGKLFLPDRALLFGGGAMSLEANNDVPLPVGLRFRDLPKLIWTLVLFVGGVAYVAMKARHQLGMRSAHTTNSLAPKER